MSALGFRYGGVHCSDFGIICKTVDFPVFAEAKENIIDVPSRDGSYIFTGDRTYYKDGVIQILCQIKADDLTQLNITLSKITNWLSRPADLSFDALPNVHYKARVNAGLSFAPMYGGRAAAVTASFAVSPLSFADTQTVITLQPGGAANGMDIVNRGYYTPCRITAQNGGGLSVTINQKTCAYDGGISCYSAGNVSRVF